MRQADFRECALDGAGDAQLAALEERPTFPEGCREVDLKTGRSRDMTREELIKRASSDFGGSGALWLERVLALDHWRIACLQADMRHKLPQLQVRANSASYKATKAAWLVLDKPATNIEDVALKLGVFMLEIGEIELKEEHARPLRQLCGELLAMVSPDAAG